MEKKKPTKKPINRKDIFIRVGTWNRGRKLIYIGYSPLRRLNDSFWGEGYNIVIADRLNSFANCLNRCFVFSGILRQSQLRIAPSRAYKYAAWAFPQPKPP